MTTIFKLILAGVLAIGLSACSEQEAEDRNNLANKDRLFPKPPPNPVWSAKNAVTRGLIDPDSATFRNVFLTTDRGLGYSIICGEVNSKNRIGGYVGYKEFAATVYHRDGDWNIDYYSKTSLGNRALCSYEADKRK